MLRLPGCIAAVTFVILAASIVSAADEGAGKVEDLVGGVMLQRGEGPATEVTSDTTFMPGDVLTCTADSQLKIVQENGTLLNVVGPAEFQIVSMGAGGTTVKLKSGLINVARAKGAPLTIESDYGVRMVVEESTGYAEIFPGDRMRFANRKGESVTVFQPDGERPQKAGELPYIIDLKKLRWKPAPDGASSPMAAGSGQLGPGVYRQGPRIIRVYPPDKVRVEKTPEGGLRFIGAGLGKNQFARVEVGFEAVLFIADGQVVGVDQNGLVDEVTGGVSFMDVAGDEDLDYEPVRDAADLSPVRTRVR
jgi:hypothetical protein